MSRRTQVTYGDSNPSSPAQMRVDTDEDLGEVLFEVNDNPICIDPQQAASIVRQLVGWLGDLAARP